ncbi:MAG TPA: glycosyltransferase family 39 protein, partial [Candidatus Hydrogenedentes bacterium]|nr:glycosyltransferase family 39 protein [Candidatus Hydrogenedentota bacterium]
MPESHLPVESPSDAGHKPLLSRTELWVLTGILIAAALLRFWYLSAVMHAPDYSALQQDPEVQDHFARAILTGDWSERPGETDPEIRTTPFYRPPGYGYLLTVLYFFSKGSYLAPRLLNVFLGLAAVYFLFRLGRHLFGPAAGLACALYSAFCGIFIYWEGEVNDPAIFVFLAVALFSLLLRWSASFKLRYLFLLGLLFGAYGLARPNILGFGPFVALWLGWIAWRHKKLRLLPAAWGTLLISTFILIVPVTVRNYVASGEFVPIATYFGHNLIIGNHEQSDGVSPWLPYLQELEGTGKWAAKDYVNVVRGLAKELGRDSISHTEASAVFAQKARAYMRAHPAETIRSMVKKWILLWTPVEITCNKVVQCELNHYLPLRFLPTFRWIAALFTSGMLLLLWALFRRTFNGRHQDAMPLVVLMILFVLYYLTSFLPFFVNGRARVPVFPVLILLGSYGVQCCAGWLKNRQYGKVAAYGITFLLSLMFFSVEWIPVEIDASRWHYQRADSWLRRGETAKALEEGKAVITAQGKAYMHQRLGREFMALGYPNDAIAQYQAGLERDPEYQDLWFLLGRAL